MNLFVFSKTTITRFQNLWGRGGTIAQRNNEVM